MHGCRLVEVDDAGKLLRDEGGAADQTAVHVGLGHQIMGVLVVHGAAVEDAQALRCLSAEDLFHSAADGANGVVGVLGRGGQAGADGPNGLVGDDQVLELLGGDAQQRNLGLQADDLVGDALLLLLKALTDADDGLEAGFTVRSVSPKY